MWRTIRDDVISVLQRDPAAHNWLQVILLYPGLHAIWLHRVANRLWHARLILLATFVSNLARWLTGIEIHPAATLGARLFIDHGMGVVIGETAEVGADVTLYHGVTLGGTSLSHGKRHPTIEDNVIIGAGAKILGNIVIGKNSRIGANAVVVKNVAAEKVVVGIPGRVIARPETPPLLDLQRGDLPEMIAERFDLLMQRLERVETRLNEDDHALEAHIDYMI